MTTREEKVSEAFVELAGSLIEDFDAVDLMQRVVDHTLGLLDAQAAGIMLADARGHLQVVAYSDHTTELLELLELQVDSGPCVDCYRSGQPVTPPDVAAMRSWWPDLSPHLEAQGFSSAQAIPLRLRSEVVGALNVFRTGEGALNAHDLKLAQALADVATVVLVSERSNAARQLLADQLQEALNSRVLLEQAKGMLAQKNGTSVDAAFQVMRTHARRTGRGLREVATAVIEALGATPS